VAGDSSERFSPNEWPSPAVWHDMASSTKTSSWQSNTLVADAIDLRTNYERINKENAEMRGKCMLFCLISINAAPTAENRERSPFGICGLKTLARRRKAFPFPDDACDPGHKYSIKTGTPRFVIACSVPSWPPAVKSKGFSAFAISSRRSAEVRKGMKRTAPELRQSLMSKTSRCHRMKIR